MLPSIATPDNIIYWGAHAPLIIAAPDNHLSEVLETPKLVPHKYIPWIAPPLTHTRL